MTPAEYCSTLPVRTLKPTGLRSGPILIVTVAIIGLLALTSCAEYLGRKPNLRDRAINIVGIVVESPMGEAWLPVADESLQDPAFSPKSEAVQSFFDGAKSQRDFEKRLVTALKKRLSREDKTRFFRDGTFERPDAGLLYAKGIWTLEGKSLLRLAGEQVSIKKMGLNIPIPNSDTYEYRMAKGYLLLREADNPSDVWTVFSIREF